jgi:uracil phosphoribosyltransferase
MRWPAHQECLKYHIVNIVVHVFVLLDATTSSADFVTYSQRAMRLLVEDALAAFPTVPQTIDTPCGPHVGVDRAVSTNQICAVSIMRSGDALVEAVRAVEPAVRIGKILIQRDESHPDKRAALFYAKLPLGIANLHVVLCDPMLATGGSALLAIKTLCESYGVNPERIVFCNLICAPEGLRALATAYPMITIVTATVDDRLNDEKYIVPGLGDFGDRFYNT